MMNAEPEPTTVLREVGDSDLEDLLRLNEAEVPAVNSIDRLQMRWFADNAAHFSVAVRNGEIAGFLIGMRPGTTYASPNYQWFCGKYGEFGYIDRVAVSANMRRLGIATRLYKDFEASLPSSVTLLTCEVNIVPPNESSMRFHEEYGFYTVGTQLLENGRKKVALMAMERNA